MDEAENCNRMVLIYHGTIIAAGTPAQMKANCMKNEVLEIILPDSQEWLEKISKLEGVKDAALFGSNIHAVVYDSFRAITAVREFLRGQDVRGFSVNKITPSLEDVFVSSIEEYDQAEPKKN